VSLTVLNLTHDRGPTRLALRAHKNAFARYSELKVIEINTAFFVDWQAVLSSEPDIVLWHTSFLSLRWGNAWPQEFEQATQALRSSGAYHIAIPQDEFLRSNSLCQLFDLVGMNLVLSCASSKDWRRIYKNAQTRDIQFRTVLTGGLDDELLLKAKTHLLPYEKRHWDLSYRAWAPEPWLGNKAQLKATIGQVAQSLSKKRNLKSSIGQGHEDTVLGWDWLKLLGSSKATLGVEGGASICDDDGSQRQAYLQNLPIDKGRDGEIDLFCLSPRHLEAAATGTLQILVEGNYNGLLLPHAHYVPVKEDLSDLADALEIIMDKKRVADITNRALNEVAYNQFCHHRYWVKQIVYEELGHINPRKPSKHSQKMRQILIKTQWINQAKSFIKRF
jgi:hypothetical protein